MRFSACVAFAFGLLLVPESAAAQKPATNSGPSRSSSQFTLRREEAGGADAQVARSRARSGDCAGALAGFDVAITKTIDPSLRRDRGLCHEKLSHPFPAIDDYRAYLTARPDAPDSDQIRQRLAALEEQQGVGGPSSKSVKEGGDDGGSGAKAEASGSVSIGGEGASASSSSSKGPKGSRAKADAAEDGSGKGFDAYAAQEKKSDDAESSALRYGEGLIIGAFLHFPRYFVGAGTTGDAGYGVGGTLRYALGGALSLISEFGFAGVGTGGANSSASGPLFMGGVELKIPITRFATDQILLKGGLGYERYTVSGTRVASNVLLGRFAVGFRHVFGPALALDLAFDGGPAYFIPEVGDNAMRGYVSGSLALLVAF